MNPRTLLCPTRWLACAALATAALLVGCNETSAKTEAPRSVLTVDLASPVRQSWPEVLEASGRVAAWEEATVAAGTGGLRLEETLVEIGDQVKKGQLLARYDDDELRMDLARLDANLVVAEATLTKSRADAERANRLEQSGAMSAQMIQTHRIQAQIAEGQVASARAERDAKAVSLRHTRVLAPDDGVISSKRATLGSVSSLGEELFRLVRGNRLEWRAEVTEQALGLLTAGTPATIKTPQGTSIEGTLRQLAPTVDLANGNSLAYVDIPPGTSLVPGMYVSGQLRLASRSALVIAESAIVRRDGNRYLVKVDQHLHVSHVKVDTGRRQGDAIELIGDISEADRFVKTGGAFLSDGDQVTVAAPLPTPP